MTLVCRDHPCYDVECHGSLTEKGVNGKMMICDKKYEIIAKSQDLLSLFYKKRLSSQTKLYKIVQFL